MARVKQPLEQAEDLLKIEELRRAALLRTVAAVAHPNTHVIDLVCAADYLASGRITWLETVEGENRESLPTRTERGGG